MTINQMRYDIKTHLTLLLMVFSFLESFPQNGISHIISFSGSGSSDRIDSVAVENLSSKEHLMLNGGNVLCLHSNVKHLNIITSEQANLIVFPNPSSEKFTLDFIAPFADEVFMDIYDQSGQKIVSNKFNLTVGRNIYWINGLENGVFFLKIHSQKYNITAKLFSVNKQTEKTTIEYFFNETKIQSSKMAINLSNKEEIYEGREGRSPAFNQKNIDVKIDSMKYSSGDILKFTGFSKGFKTTVIDIPTQSKNLNINFVACEDNDENTYSVVQVNTQTWMCENLKSTKYNNNDALSNFADANSTSGKYCSYENNEILSDTYGYLYNFDAVVDKRSIVPRSWHIPSKEEFEMLSNFLKSNEPDINYNDSYEVEQKRKTGYKTLFTSFLGGIRDQNATFKGLNSHGNWWTSSIDSINNMITSQNVDSSAAISAQTCKNNEVEIGMSIRGVLGEEPRVSTLQIESVTSKSIVCHGEILSDGYLPIISHGFCWSTSPNPTIAASKISHEFQGNQGEFKFTIDKLGGNTLYYVRAYATNGYGVGYGEQISVKTLKNKLAIAGYSNDIVLFKHTDGRIFCTKNGDFSIFDRNGQNKKTIYNFANHGYAGFNIHGAMLLPSGTVIVALTQYKQTLKFLRSTNSDYTSWELVHDDWNGQMLYKSWAVNPEGTMMIGEYPTHNNILSVRLWKVTSDGRKWEVAHIWNGRQGNITTEKTIFHIHTVDWDKYNGHWWIGCGDLGNESTIYEYDGQVLTLIGEGTQNMRTTSFIFTPDYIIYGADGCMHINGKCRTYIVQINKITKQLNILREVFETTGGSMFNNEIISNGSNLTYLACGTPNAVYLSNDGNEWDELLNLKLDPQKPNSYTWFYNFVDNYDGRFYGFVTGIIREDTNEPFIGTVILDLK